MDLLHEDRPENLVDWDSNKFKEFMDSFDHVFSDCDGVLWLAEPLPQVGLFFEAMERLGKTVHFVSNCSIRSKENYESKFQQAGIENGYEKLIIPSRAIADFLVEHNFHKAAYCVTCPETIKVLEAVGIRCKSGPDLASDFHEDYEVFSEEDPDIGAVIFDSDLRGNLAKLHKAINYLRNPDVLFICGSTDRLIHFRKGGTPAIGCSIFTDIVAVETCRIPIILSKPSKEFGEYAMRRAGITRPNRVLFIGDMIEQDIAIGKATGFKTLMLLTNTSFDAMMAHGTKPDYYIESLASIVPKFYDVIPSVLNGVH